MKTDPNLEKDLVDYQNLERQMQNVLLQKHQLQMQLNEINLALDELKKAEGEVFKSVGSIMVKTTKDDAEKDLHERKKLNEMRLNTLNKQEEEVKSRLMELRTKLETAFQGMKPPKESS